MKKYTLKIVENPEGIEGIEGGYNITLFAQNKKTYKSIAVYISKEDAQKNGWTTQNLSRIIEIINYQLKQA